MKMWIYRSIYILHTYSYTDAVTHTDAHTNPHMGVCIYIYTYSHAPCMRVPASLVFHMH